MVYGISTDKERNLDVEEPWLARVVNIKEKASGSLIKVQYLEKIFGRAYALCESKEVITPEQMVGPVKVHKSVSHF